MVTIDRNGAHHASNGEYTNKPGASAGFDLGEEHLSLHENVKTTPKSEAAIAIPLETPESNPFMLAPLLAVVLLRLKQVKDKVKDKKAEMGFPGDLLSESHLKNNYHYSRNGWPPHVGTLDRVYKIKDLPDFSDGAWNHVLHGEFKPDGLPDRRGGHTYAAAFRRKFPEKTAFPPDFNSDLIGESGARVMFLTFNDGSGITPSNMLAEPPDDNLSLKNYKYYSKIVEVNGYIMNIMVVLDHLGVVSVYPLYGNRVTRYDKRKRMMLPKETPK